MQRAPVQRIVPTVHFGAQQGTWREREHVRMGTERAEWVSSWAAGGGGGGRASVRVALLRAGGRACVCALAHRVLYPLRRTLCAAPIQARTLHSRAPVSVWRTARGAVTEGVPSHNARARAPAPGTSLSSAKNMDRNRSSSDSERSNIRYAAAQPRGSLLASSAASQWVSAGF
jgi:hypothetical protein